MSVRVRSIVTPPALWLASVWAVVMVALFIHGESLIIAAEPVAIHEHQTDGGIRFIVRGEKPAKPAPTIFLFAQSPQGAVSTPFSRMLGEHDFVAVSLFLPHHGDEEFAQGYTGSLVGWARRVDAGDGSFVPAFTDRVSAVLDYLIREGYTDPQQVTIGGTSRGGFFALHTAAVEPRIRRVVVFSPVTDLRALREFEGLRGNALAGSLSTAALGDRLVGTEVWMCIGNQDDRVSTDGAIATAQAIVRSATVQDRNARVWLHVMPSKGHYTPAGADEMAARWLLARQTP